MSIIFNGINVNNINYNGVELDKVIYNNTVVFDPWTSFTDTKSATGDSHYGVDINIGNDYLANKKINYLRFYSDGRERTGDSFIRGWFTYKNKEYGNFQYGSSGTLDDGTAYTWSGEKNAIIINFSTPINLTSIRSSCGSEVGQWREHDTINVEIKGYQR